MQLCHRGCSVMNTGGFLLCAKDICAVSTNSWYKQVLQLWNAIATAHHKDISEFPALPLQLFLWELCRTEATCNGHRLPQIETPPRDNFCMESLEGQLIIEGHQRWTGTTTGSPKATKTSSSLKPLEVQPCNLYDWVSLCQPLGFQIEH